MAVREPTCVNKFDRPLVGHVQIVWSCTIPGRSCTTIYCRVNCQRISGMEVVEGAHEKIQLAKSLDMWREILVQCVNPFTKPVELMAGSLVRRFHSVQEREMWQSLGETTEYSH